MSKYIIDQLIITAGQWQQFKEKKYERQFDLLLESLQRNTGTSREQAVNMLVADLGG